MKILIIEDEPALAESIQSYLQADFAVCERAATLDEALSQTSLYRYDCILVDIGLPDGSGLDLIKKLKEEQSEAGIIIISAKNSLDDKISGLDLGADDYLTKPFHLSELSARIKALIRRKQFAGARTITFREIVIFPEERRVEVKGEPVRLTRSELDLLLYFLANVNRVLSRESIAEHLIGEEADHLDSFDFLYSHVKNLRKKLLDHGAGDYVQAIYGIGYQFTAP